MRTNSPTPANDDFSVLALPDENQPSPLEKVTKEHLDLAKAAKSADGQIILEHLQKRIDDFTSQLKNIDLVKVDPTTALARTMAAQLVIAEFEAVLKDCETSIQAVEDAAKASKTSGR